MPQNPTPAAAGDTNPTTPMPGEDAIREQVRRLLATAEGYDFDRLESHDYQDHASVVLDMIRPLVSRVAELEALLNGSQPQDRMERWSAAAFAAGRVVDRNALRVYMAVADAEAKDAAETARTEALADAGDYMDNVGQKDAAYLLYTTDVPVARNMRPVPTSAPSQREAGAL